MKRLYIEAKTSINLDKILKKIKIPERKVGIITTVQFEHEVKKIKDPRFIFGGSILGCNVDTAIKIEKQVDAFLFIGSGDFHPSPGTVLHPGARAVDVATPLGQNQSLDAPLRRPH